MKQIDELYKIIEDRKLKMPKNSYVASLFRAGKDRIIQKVGEEAVETVIAAKNNDKQQIIFETADLVFHLLILLSAFDIKFDDILNKLESRKYKKYDNIERNDI